MVYGCAELIVMDIDFLNFKSVTRNSESSQCCCVSNFLALDGNGVPLENVGVFQEMLGRNCNIPSFPTELKLM
jgi:hypothetical protein